MNGFKLSKTWYYIISFTWGLPMNLLGVVIAIPLLILGYRPKQNMYGWYFEIGEDLGGVNFGFISIVAQNPSSYILQHEFGHSIQNCIFGIYFLPLVAIPSMLRYWYRRYLVTVKKVSYLDLPPYDSIWFEGQATLLGEKYSENLQK